MARLEGIKLILIEREKNIGEDPHNESECLILRTRRNAQKKLNSFEKLLLKISGKKGEIIRKDRKIVNVVLY